MKEFRRKELHTLAKHSNLDAKNTQHLLEEYIYPGKEDWQKFLKILFLSLAVGFTVCGIIFFFAYNWETLNRFLKFAMIQILVISGTGFYLFAHVNSSIKNIIITGTSMLVGALFAVYGQVYQTGANAYDFFLGWTVFISIWVLVANYAPLWLLYTVLINTTFYFYTEQVANDWSTIYIILIFFIFNLLTLITFLTQPKYKPALAQASWYIKILAIGCAILSTMTLVVAIDDIQTLPSIIIMIGIILFYGYGILYANANKSIFYISLIALSTILSILYLLIDRVDDSGLILLSATFCIIAFTAMIKSLLALQKKWNNEK